jgi:bifunctional N-acetylglucosamine-1-phosphate-uridyltransferase/glucosamine-1-phosphate-acetyltransferase GlmU-like protein
VAELRALIAAGGRATRAALPYPKTLFALQGRPILLRILDLLAPYDPQPTVVVSPEGRALVADCLAAAGREAWLVEQAQARGMGDAVLRFEASPASSTATDVLLIWGDVPFIQPATVAAVIEAHRTHRNDFTFATRVVDAAYTVVSRDTRGAVTGVVETREAGIAQPRPGERDVGLFVFRKDVVFAALREEHADKWGRATGEHGFLYVVRHLAARGCRVEALDVATELDLVSLNSLKDVDAFLDPGTLKPSEGQR